jgi:oxygen-independent coproporphyrinogen-3 oxidase
MDPTTSAQSPQRLPFWGHTQRVPTDESPATTTSAIPAEARESIRARALDLRDSIDLDQIESAGLQLDPLEYDFVYGYPSLGSLPRVENPGLLLQQPRPSSQLALYLHFPFCRYSCSFCYFAKQTHPTRSFIDDYLTVLAREVRTAAGWAEGTKITSVYFGGGTPTYLESDDLLRVIELVRSSFRLTSDYEWTVEASPETISPSKANAIVAEGVNRISLGVQSFDPKILSAMVRSHTPNGAVRAVETIFASGVQHHNIDLIYGFPGQHPEDLWRELEVIAQLDLRSVTWYQLWQQMDTPLRRQESRCRQVKLEDILHFKCFIAAAMSVLEYQRDKVDWFVKGASEAQRQQEHKWACGDFLGVGLSAYGFLSGVYYRNWADPQKYAQAVRASGLGIGYAKSLEAVQFARRRLALGIKRHTGIPVAMLSCFDAEDRAVFGNKVRILSEAGLLEVRNGRICLTEVGQMYGNETSKCLAFTEDDLLALRQWRDYC